jgi:glycosyltransferase involved in cell wall biosynthesis
VPHPRAVDLEFRDSLDVLAATLGVTEHVIFTGYMDVVEDLYEAVDVIVNPARVNEGFGRVAVEALAAGRPVVSSRTGAVPEILDDGQTALLVEPGDPAAVARAVLRLVDDAELRRRLMVAGRALVGRRFRESSGVDEFLRVVDTVLLTRGNEHGRAGLG